MKSDNRKITAQNYIEGNISLSGNAKFEINNDNSKKGWEEQEIQRLFSQLYIRIEQEHKLSKQTREDLRTDVEEIHRELSGKKEQANESFIMKRLRNIGRMAPDILEVALALLTNLPTGLGILGQKIVVKMRESAS